VNREENCMTDPVIEDKKLVPAPARIPWWELVIAWRDAALIVVLSAAAALAFNALRANGLPLLRYAPFDLLGPCPEIADDIPRLPAGQLKPGDPNLVIVDVRLAWDHLGGHLPGAWFLPMYETASLDEAVVARLRSLKPGTWIVLTGAAGTATAERALTALAGQGLRGLYVLEGGVEAWGKLGRPLESTSIPVLLRESGHPADRIFIDARDEDAFAAGHREGAIHLPFDDLLPPEEELLDRLREVKDREFVVYAAEPLPAKPDGHRPVHPAYGVAAELVARGFRNVSILAEPFTGPQRTTGPGPEGPATEDASPASPGVTP
jgi:rhodanese-related sulfurtransferase